MPRSCRNPWFSRIFAQFLWDDCVMKYKMRLVVLIFMTGMASGVVLAVTCQVLKQTTCWAGTCVPGKCPNGHMNFTGWTNTNSGVRSLCPDAAPGERGREECINSVDFCHYTCTHVPKCSLCDEENFEATHAKFPNQQYASGAAECTGQGGNS